jgi:hypothetical protein
MALEHRYAWSTAFVKALLRKECLSEAASFRYFLAIMVFDWLQFTVIATTPTPTVSLWSAVSSWANFATTLLGLLYLYGKNGGSAGTQFLHRYFPLSITVGWKFVIAIYVVLWLIPVALAGQSNETLGWSATVALTVINSLMFWRIGHHLNSLAE